MGNTFLIDENIFFVNGVSYYYNLLFECVCPTISRVSVIMIFQVNIAYAVVAISNIIMR